MRPIKVYLNVGEHPIYKDLVAYPPKGVAFSGMRKTKQSLSIYSSLSNIKRRSLMRMQSFLKIPRVTFIKTDADLIHSSRGILIMNEKPWVMDIEHVLSFVGHNQNTLNSAYCQNIIKKFLNSSYCKKIMPHSNAARTSILSIFKQKNIVKKIETMYPAIKPEKGKQRKDNDFINLLFVGLHFYDKGGKEVLDAFNILRRKYDVKLTVRSNVDKKIITENKYVTFFPQTIPRKKLLDIYSSSDIFIFPTYIDTFGLVLLDSMANLLPIVASDVFSIPEIVENGTNGFLVHSPLSIWGENGLNQWYKNLPDFRKELMKPKPEFVKKLADQIALIIENDSLRKKMGKNGKKLVEKGKFSLNVRNKKLKTIYENAIKY